MRSLSALPASLLALIAIASAHVSARADEELQIEHINDVTCSRPSENGDRIAVHYRGTLQSTGAEFDQSYKRGAPFVFQLGAGRVIQGWDKGLLDMCPGEKRTLIIPPGMGYGEANMGVIPPHSTLVFETELIDIVGINQDFVSTVVSSIATPTATATPTEDAEFSIATAPSTPPVETVPEEAKPQEEEQKDENVEEDESVVVDEDDNDEEADELVAQPLDPGDDNPMTVYEMEKAECQLLGPFALIVQAALGAVAVLSLVYKRFREDPKRPWKIWLFDVSKQVLGSALLHVLNLAMSMFSSGDAMKQMQKQALAAAKENGGHMPNPCSFYLLNLAIDTTIGIPVLYILLKVLHAMFLRTFVANPPESIKSGNYGQPPKLTWYLKQLLIYFIGLVGMKLFVLFLFSALPWLPWVGDWALRWTQSNEALQIAFVMFIFPVCMNAIQYYIIDSFIMDKKQKGGEDGYEQVHSHDDDESRGDEDDESLEGATEVEEDAVPKGGASSGLKEADPTPIPSYSDVEGGRSSPKAEQAEQSSR